MKISIVIPSKNEAAYVEQLIDFIQNNSNQENIEEIIIVESFNTNQIVKVAEKRHAKLYYNLHGTTELQMDMGAFQAKGEIIYFIKPKCIPPTGFDERIIKYIKNKQTMGCFDFPKSGSDNLFKKIYHFVVNIFTRNALQVNSFYVINKLYYDSGGLKKHDNYFKLKKEVAISYSKLYL